MNTPELPGQTFRGLKTYDEILERVNRVRPDWPVEKRVAEAQAALTRKRKLTSARVNTPSLQRQANARKRILELAEYHCPKLTDKEYFLWFVDALAEEFGKQVDITSKDIYEGATTDELREALRICGIAKDKIEEQESTQMRDRIAEMQVRMDAKILDRQMGKPNKEICAELKSY
jgi:hypothetical protein